MKINSIKVNGYGKLKNKDIELKNKINIIYGENESGKSTIFNFILSMFYGASKSKKGKSISDLERFTPWNGEDFSGEIIYQLDNGEEYTVYREFKKKSPVIYDKNGEDITSKYIIDKNNGNQFLYDQTKIDEELFLSGTAIMQQGVKIDNTNKNTIIQKLSNMVGSGNDNVSLKKTLDKLNKKQLVEIGTERSQDRPINRINSRLEILKNEKNGLLMYQDMKYSIEETNEKVKEKIQTIENEIKDLQEKVKLEQKIIVEEEKIKINKQVNEANEAEIRDIEQIKLKKQKELKEIKGKNKVKKNNGTYLILFVIVCIINIISMKLINSNLKYISLVLFPILITIYCINYNKQKSKVIEEKKAEIAKIESQLEILINNANMVKKEIELLEDNLKKEIPDKEQIRNSQETLTEKTNELNSLKLKLHSIELDKNNILPKLDNLSNIEEEIKALEDEKIELIKKNKSIDIAKETLEEAYQIMKNNITPKFINNLSDIISNISNGKYDTVKLNEENQLIVKLSTGKNIPIELLSTGTIEQLYLSFRMAVIKELTEENMPLILDETYAFYDDVRLANILQYLEKIDKQIIIFTCTNREKEILEKSNIDHNYIKLSNGL